jgi:mRNA-degrading endonuclease RelE of RelBE toxin-antitoxin system
MPVTDIGNVAKEIQKQLKYYAADVKEKVEAAQNESAKELARNLKRDSPKKTGAYSKGWRIKRAGNKLIVHNKTNYQLTHLLEYGHPKKNGGRVESQVHIRPNEEKAVKDYLGKIERAIEE